MKYEGSDDGSATYEMEMESTSNTDQQEKKTVQEKKTSIDKL